MKRGEESHSQVAQGRGSPWAPAWTSEVPSDACPVRPLVYSEGTWLQALVFLYL